MRFLRLKVDGFGGLRGEFVFDPGRVTVLLDDNERGKSTLVAAITAALYGLEDNRHTHRPLTPLERWRPWIGGAYRVELDVESRGERYTIARDFERGTVSVWNAAGQEITVEFKQGKDDYPVGHRLCGLDADEFAKCALVRHQDLDGVVPADEKSRRSATLHARLENAADTRVGDTNASEALRVLDGALRKYTSNELDSTLTVENAIQRLQDRRELIRTDLSSLEYDFSQIAAPLEMLVSIDEEERATRERMRELDYARRDNLVRDLREQLDADDRHRADLEELRREAQSLSAAAAISADAESEFRETVTRHQEAERHLAALETRRQEELAREREKREAELRELKAFASATVEDADRCVSLAAELRQVAEEDSGVRTAVFTLRESLASQGHDPERIQQLTGKFGNRSEAEQRLLRSQSQRALVYQTEVATLERARTESTEVLRDIDALRNRWHTPAWLIVALGLAGVLAGAVVPALGGLRALWISLLAGGGALLALGLALLQAGGRARLADRTEALRLLSDAQRRLNQMREQRAGSEVELGELALAMGYRDHVDLLREWAEYERLIGDSAPALRAQERLAALEARRRAAVAAATPLLAAFGGGAAQPADLERVAQGIRQSLAVRERLAELEAGWSWLDDERRVAEATVTGLKERAARCLRSAGLEYDPALSWADHAQRLASRVQGRARHELLIRELIPQAERRTLPSGRLAELRNQLEMIDAERPAETEPAATGADSGEPPSRSPLQIDAEGRRQREVLDRVQKRRTELLLEVKEVQRRYYQEHPDKTAQLERVRVAEARAQRFKAAVELARDTIQRVATDTHRRWAEFLNGRVKEIATAFGTGIEQLRFGDDLDFSVRLVGGAQAARGKADLQLSAGAKDQLYLAVRLAIGEYLARGGSPVPFLLDDPFASSDDARARAGMRLLIEHIAPTHQVLVLTCHRARFEALAALDPELYGERVQRLMIEAGLPALP